VPTDITIWNWLFGDKNSVVSQHPQNDIKGFFNCETLERISFLDVKAYSTYVSTALVKKYGLKEGDTVALFSQNTVWYPVAMHAATRAGAMVSGASPAYNTEEMTYALQKSSAKFLMTVPGSMDIAAAAAKAAGISKENVFLLEGELEGFKTIKDLLEIGKSYGGSGQVKPWTLPPGKKNKDICGFMSFSSGTTGLPKAVCLT
jgi:4-coumarate--CoA ligase